MRWYVPKHSRLEAMQWDGSKGCFDRFWAWVGDYEPDPWPDGALVLVKDGRMKIVPVGSWLLRDGETLAVVDDQVFQRLYEPATVGEGRREFTGPGACDPRPPTSRDQEVSHA